MSKFRPAQSNVDWRNHDWLYEQYVVNKLSWPEIGFLVGRTAVAVRLAAKNFGITSRTMREYRQEFDMQRMVELYASGQSATQIATIMGSSASVVLTRLRETGIQLRDNVTARRLRWETRPGKRIPKAEWVNYEWLSEKYATKSVSEIAKIVGWSYGCVFKALQLTGVVKRTYAESALMRSDTISHAVRTLWLNESYRTNVVAACRARWQDPECRAVMTESSRANWRDHEYRLKMAAVRAATPRISSLQVRLYQYLDDLSIDYHPEGEATRKGWYVFDCTVPLPDGKSLLIECQGDYWHALPKAIRNDRSKFTYIQRYYPDCEIMYIWEHEFNVHGRVLDRLKLKLGLALDTVDFAFTDVTVRQVTGAETKCFLDAYHYIGNGRGGLACGAFLGSELIACIVYSPPLRQNTAAQFGLDSCRVRELSRMCIHPRYHKKNFASWLIARSLRYVDAELIIAYADTTVGHTGTVYRASNFQLHHVVPADYWYVDAAGYAMHKRTLYGKAVQMGCTEAEFAGQHGYIKRFGGTKLAFVRRLHT